MTEDQKQIIIHIIANQLGIHDSEVESEQRLDEDLNCDSLDKANLVIELEHQLKITITNEVYEEIKTVQDIFNAVGNCL